MNYYSFKRIDKNKNNPSIYIMSQPRSGTSFLTELLNNTIKNKENIPNNINLFNSFGEYFTLHFFLMFLKKNDPIFDFLLSKFKIKNNIKISTKQNWFNNYFNKNFLIKISQLKDIYPKEYFNYKSNQIILKAIKYEYFNEYSYLNKKTFLNFQYFPKYTKVFIHQLRFFGVNYIDFFKIVDNIFEIPPIYIFLYRDVNDITASNIIKNKTILSNNYNNFNIEILNNDIINMYNKCLESDILLKNIQKKMNNYNYKILVINFNELTKNTKECIENIIKFINFDEKYLYEKKYRSNQIKKISNNYIPTKIKKNFTIVETIKFLKDNNFLKI